MRLDREIECEVLLLEKMKAARTATTTTTSPVHLDTAALQAVALAASADVELDVEMISFKDHPVPCRLRAACVHGDAC